MASFDDDAQAEEIEAKIERLRRLRGWTGDTVQVKAVADDPPPPVQAPPPTIVLRWADRGQKRETVIDHDNFEIGSGEKAHLRILDPAISTRHCRISFEDGGHRVRDLRSTSGTFVNETQVPLSHPLKHGDSLRLGTITFAVAEHGQTDDSGEVEDAKTIIADIEPVHTPAPPRPAGSIWGAPAPSTPATTQAPRPTAQAQAPTPPTPPVAPVAPPVAVPHRTPVPPVVEEALSEATLRWFDALGNECEIVIKRDQPVLVGRRPECGIRLKDDGSVSSRHCIFELEGEQLVLRDLGSTNGTFIDKNRVSRQVLKEGDVVYCGLTGIRVFLGRQRKSASGHNTATAVRRSAAYFIVHLSPEGGVMTTVVDAAAPDVAFGDTYFSWKDGHLRASGPGLVINGVPIDDGPLDGGQVLTTDGVRFHVVREAARRERPPINVSNVARWLKAIGAENPELEVLLIDPTSIGGRIELCMWGDGVVEVDVHRDGAKSTFRGQVDKQLLRAILMALAAAGFPDTLNVDEANVAAPEIHVFAGEDRAKVVVGSALANAISAYATARELLFGIAAEVAGL